MSLDVVIVAVVVAGAAVYLGRVAYRVLSGKSAGACGCSSCPAAPKTDSRPR